MVKKSKFFVSRPRSPLQKGTTTTVVAQFYSDGVSWYCFFDT